VLAAVIAAWLLLAAVVATGTPAWEANDEPDHVRNAAVLASGDWYRIGEGSGLESHQAPLYYLLLAGWDNALGMNSDPPAPPPLDGDGNVFNGIYQDVYPNAGLDERRVLPLRVVSIALGLLTLLLTYLATRRLTRDPWTPVVAVALVACVPRFTFLSGVVNNDNLANALGAAGLLLGVIALAPRERSPRAATLLAAGLGAIAGALVLAKLSTAPLVPVLALAAVAALPGRRARLRALGVFAAAAAVVCGWWLVQNQVRYGDPLAADASREYLEPLLGTQYFAEPTLRRLTIDLPKGIFRSFWYTSGHNQFVWPFWAYWPFWILLVAGLAGLVAPLGRTLWAPRRTVVFVSLAALSGLVAVYVVGIETQQNQARVGFFALPALGALFALGAERLRAPVLARFALPVLGLAATLFAIRDDIFVTAY
jgi:hypothetical protein